MTDMSSGAPLFAFVAIKAVQTSDDFLIPREEQKALTERLREAYPPVSFAQRPPRHRFFYFTTYEDFAKQLSTACDFGDGVTYPGWLTHEQCSTILRAAERDRAFGLLGSAVRDRKLLEVSPSFAVGIAQRPEQPELPPATSTVAGAAALVAGTTVGAGILALPAKTLAAGFLPSSGALVLAWIYMASSGILIAEVNVNTVCGLGRNSVSISSMASDTLGDGAARLSGVAYVFIHYCLLVAYTVSGGAIVAEVLQLPTVAGSVGFTAVLGSALLAGTYQQVERVNSALVAGVVGTFGALLWSGIPNIQPELLAHAEPAAVLPAVPVLVLSLVYHNIVPTITFQLGCDLPKIRKAIVLGSFVPLVMFLALDAVVLGATPFDAAAGMAPGEIFDPLLALRSSGGAFAETVRSFTLLAIVTSCIGFTYGLSDYWADLLGWEAPDALDSEDGAEAAERPLPEKAALYGLTLVPPLAIACSDPSLFFTALDNAGAFGVLTLFGILPAAMAWEQRYGLDANPAVEPALPGGRAVLAFMGTAALGVVGIQAWERLAAALQLS